MDTEEREKKHTDTANHFIYIWQIDINGKWSNVQTIEHTSRPPFNRNSGISLVVLIFLELTHVVVKGSHFSRLLFMFFNRLIYIHIQVRRKRWRNLKLTLIWNIIRPRSLLIFISKIIKCECKRGTHFMLNIKNINKKTPPYALCSDWKVVPSI